MAQKQEVYIIVTATVTGPDGKPVASKVLKRVPDALVDIDFSQLSPALIATFETATIDPATLSNSCGINFTPQAPTPQPPAGNTNPAWKLALPDQEAGGSYSYIITADNFINLPAGVSVNRIVKTGGTLPYLGLVNESVFPAQLVGSVPGNAVAGTISLMAYLTPASAGQLPFTAPVGVKAAAVTGLEAILRTSPSNIIVSVGPDSTTSTTIRLVKYPSGYGQTGTYQMVAEKAGPYTAISNHYTYFYFTYNAPIAGRYVFEIKRGAQTAYGVCTYNPNGQNDTLGLTLYDKEPDPTAMLGDMQATVNGDRTVSLSVVASGAVQITPPRLSSAPATAYVDMNASGNTYGYSTGVLTPEMYSGTYRLKSGGAEKQYLFVVSQTTVQAVDRIDTNGGLDEELIAKLSFADGLQFRVLTKQPDGSFLDTDYTPWADAAARVDPQGYQYGGMTVRTPAGSATLYKHRWQIRPRASQTAAITIDTEQVTTNTGRRTIYTQDDVYAEADKADFEGNGSSSPTTTGDGFDTTYAYAYAGPATDFRGTTVERSVAPVIVAQQKSKPRSGAGRYNFPVQKALNTFLPKRHPEFSLPFSWDGSKMKGWLVPYPGPDFSADRLSVLARGFNAVAESTPNRAAYGAGKGYFNVSGGYGEAKIAADKLPDGDSRKAILLKWWNGGAGGGESIVDGPTCELFGIEIYNQRQNVDWTSINGGPFLAVTLNFEVSKAPAGSGKSEEQARMDMIGLVMRGVRKAALAKGHVPPMLVCYDHAGLAFINPQLISRDLPGTSGTYGDFGNITYSNAIAGLPAYFNGEFLSISVVGGSGNSPMTAGNEMVKYVQEFGGVMGSQEYMNSTWDDQSLWQKNADGTFKTRVVKDKNGIDRTLLVRRTDARRTTIQGEIADLLAPAVYYDGEASAFLEDWYRLAHMGPVEYTARAGRQHYAKSDVRQAGFEKMLLGHWTRSDCEFKLLNRIQNPAGGYNVNPATGNTYDQPAELKALNARPLNPDFAEFDLIHNLVCCLRDLYRPWMAPQPVIATLGQSLDSTAFADYGNHARGIYEIYQKAMNRANQFAWVKGNVMQPLWGELAVRNFARDRSWHDINGEFEKKAIVNALTCNQRADRNNTPWMVLAGTFPAMDVGTTTTLTAWCLNDDGTADGPSYQIEMGHNIGIDDFQITASQATKPPRNWRYRYTDMTGEVRVRAFDYREPNPTTNLVPPAAA